MLVYVWDFFLSSVQRQRKALSIEFFNEARINDVYSDAAKFKD